MAQATITIAVGERIITVPLQDARSLGFLDNGVMRVYGDMYDGHGNLLDKENQVFANDLVEIGIAARSGWETAVRADRPQLQDNKKQ